jgi:hypothetical protein
MRLTRSGRQESAGAEFPQFAPMGETGGVETRRERCERAELKKPAGIPGLGRLELHQPEAKILAQELHFKIFRAVRAQEINGNEREVLHASGFRFVGEYEPQGLVFHLMKSCDLQSGALEQTDIGRQVVADHHEADQAALRLDPAHPEAGNLRQYSELGIDKDPAGRTARVRMVGGIEHAQSAVAVASLRPQLEERLAELHGLGVFDEDLGDDALGLRLDLVHHLHRLNDANDRIRIHLGPDIHVIR